MDLTLVLDPFVIFMALVPIIVSPVAMLAIRNTLEYGKPHIGFNPKGDSWAYLFGDMIALPISLGAAATVARRTSWWDDWWWATVAVSVAILASVGFRAMDSATYVKQGHGDRLYSPTKLWHDFVVYPVVGTMLCWLGIPAITVDSIVGWASFGGQSWLGVPTFWIGTTAGWLTIGGFVAWLLFAVCDMIRGLRPEDMHPRVQDTKFGDSFR